MLENTALQRATLSPSVANEFSVEASQKIRRRHDLLRWIATDLNQRGPQLPITKEGYERLSGFCSAVLRGRSFNSAPIKPYEIPMMIDPAGWTDTTVPRCGQRLVAFLQAVSQEIWAEGIACDFTSNASVSSWMMIDIGFSLSPHFKTLFKVRGKREHRVITTTVQGELAIGTHVHVRLPRQVYYHP